MRYGAKFRIGEAQFESRSRPKNHRSYRLVGDSACKIHRDPHFLRVRDKHGDAEPVAGHVIWYRFKIMKPLYESKVGTRS